MGPLHAPLGVGYHWFQLAMVCTLKKYDCGFAAMSLTRSATVMS
eukprot:CAMPEP_0115222744 /NCGR_PEP_ID=MMETSP0270-20121206/28673_1 /TAXON_ID=71861 /ORGANISM="Scrippsiella trochoidea, Strain CCMP3099" /LENGTH=43 /DNA_ID= /DNA_START= /DNA_END= /DNA_ORIENTATION=